MEIKNSFVKNYSKFWSLMLLDIIPPISNVAAATLNGNYTLMSAN